MDLVGSTSDVEESQATQMLLDLMPDRNSSILSPTRTTNATTSPVALSTEAASDSFSSSRQPNSLPTYHYHGLASTQTETQQILDEGQAEEGSQKENIQNAQASSSYDGKAEPLVEINRESSSKATASKSVPADQSARTVAHMKPKTPNPRPVAIGIQDFPRGRTAVMSKSTQVKKQTVPLPSRQSKRKQPVVSRDSSQDSFAREPTQNVPEHFIAANKQFDVPLSDLQRDQDPEDESDVEAQSPSRSYVFMRNNQREPIDPVHHGNILVQATPSTSAGSQSQPAQSFPHDTQLIEQAPRPSSAYSDGGYESSESFGRSLMMPPSSPPRPAEPQEYVQTQIVADSDMEAPPHPWATRTTYSTTGTSNAASSRNTSNGQGNPRSLLALYKPTNDWRYSKYQQGLAHSPNKSPERGAIPSIWGDTQPTVEPSHRPPGLKQSTRASEWQDTQPVGYDDAHSRRGLTASVPPSSAWEETQPTTEEVFRPSRRQLAMPRSHRAASNPSGWAPPSPPADNMEVVPDSEPLAVRSPIAAHTDNNEDVAPVLNTPRRTSGSKANSSPVAEGALKALQPQKNTPRLASATGRPTPSSRRRVVVEEIASDSEKDEALPQTVEEKPKQMSAGESDADTEEDAEDDKPMAKPAAAEEEEEGSDEDIPLATIVKMSVKGKGVAKGGRSKSKQVATPKPKNPPAPKTTGKNSNRTGQGKDAQPPSKRPRIESNAVRLAVTGQGTRSVSQPPPPTAKKGRAIKNLPPRSRTTRSTASRPNYEDPPTDADEEDDDPIENVDDEHLDDLADLSSLTNGYEDTEPADDDDYQEVEVPSSGPSARKRKRGATQVTLKQEKLGTGRGSPEAKRQRAVTKEPARLINENPTRVFALWKSENHYYPGIVEDRLSKGHYKIHFDDDTYQDVSLHEMRQCLLRASDDVCLPNKSRSYKVVQADFPLLPNSSVVVDVEGVRQHLTLQAIKIAGRTITHAWKDRVLDDKTIVPRLAPLPPKKVPPAIEPSETNVAEIKAKTKTKGRRTTDKPAIFSNTGIILSMSPAADSSQKDALTKKITQYGGSCIDDITTCFNMDGQHQDRTRWIIQKDEVRFTGDFQRLFLVADDSHQKPKFLMALALGIPVVHMKWVMKCVQEGEEVPWIPYLVPQGYSDQLHCRLTQQVDIEWGNTPSYLEDIMGNTAPAKVFKGASILCVGHDIMPQPNRGKVTINQKSTNALARVILCMGPDYVEAVVDPKYASQDLSNYTYIVVRDLSKDFNIQPRSKLVDWAWVKSCLIASRLLEMPCADFEDAENSQEA